MLGKIIGIEGNTVLLKLGINLSEVQNIINLYVIFDDGETKNIGEIIDIKIDTAYINLIGSIEDERFLYGVSKKPSFKSSVKLVSKERIHAILGMNNYVEKRDLYIGNSPLYDGIKIGVNINEFFSKHVAIFGATG